MCLLRVCLLMPLEKAKYARKFKGKKKKKKVEGAVSLCFSLNDSFSLVESSADSLAALQPVDLCPTGTLALCAQGYLCSQRSQLYRPGAMCRGLAASPGAAGISPAHGHQRGEDW